MASSPPDGYVLLASPPGPIAINDNLYKKLAFQPSKFEPVIVLGTVPNVLVVKPAFPAKTAAELIDYVKANPGKVTFASQGNGSTSHLSAMLFQKLTGTEMVHVPYRGTAPALQDIMGNHVDLFFDNLGSSLNLHNAGNLRILALGSPQRVPSLPDIPTLAEAGVDQFQSITWFAVVAPPGTPAAITQTLNQAIGEVLQQPGVREQFEKMGVRPLGGSVEETERFIAEERERWADVIRTTNVKDRVGAGCTEGLRRSASQRQCQQGVDLPAIEHHDALGKPQRTVARIRDDHIAIAAGGEHHSLAAVHYAHDDEARAGSRSSVLCWLQQRQANDMSIALSLVDIGLAERAHTILQHGARGRVDHPEWQTLLEVLGRRDDIACGIREEPRPLL